MIAQKKERQEMAGNMLQTCFLIRLRKNRLGENMFLHAAVWSDNIAT